MADQNAYRKRIHKKPVNFAPRKSSTLALLLAISGQIVTSCSTVPTAPAKVSEDRVDQNLDRNVSSRKVDPEDDITSPDYNPYSTWYEKNSLLGLLDLSKMRKKLKDNLFDPHINYSRYENSQVNCQEFNSLYRSADGTCYEESMPLVGSAGTAFGRNVDPKYIDTKANENLMTPDPALISKNLFTREEFKPVPFLNMLAASWIQFMNHDWLTHGKNAESNPYLVTNRDGEKVEIERTKENPLDESTYKKEFQKVTINDVTHWWDGSQIYGSNLSEQQSLRTFELGLMRTELVNGKEVLPKDSSLNIQMNKQNHGYEQTGFRDNWWVGLSMLHLLFVKEHNYIAKELVKNYARLTDKKGENGEELWAWTYNMNLGRKIMNRFFRHEDEKKGFKYLTAKELDEHVFNVARLINAAVMAKIHTVEWTPAILPNPVLKKAMYANWYGLLNPKTLNYASAIDMSVILRGSGSDLGHVVAGIVGSKEVENFGAPFSITEEFTSVYRLHSLLPENLHLKKFGNPRSMQPLPFAESRNEKSYGLMTDYNLRDLFYSFGTQNPGQLVLNNFPKFMQELTIPGRGKMDLAMVDIIRDRERGVPRYNNFRRAIDLKPLRNFADFYPKDDKLNEAEKKAKEEGIKKLRDVYGVDANGKDNIEMVDLLVGTSAEVVRPKHFGFGETMFQIFILMASRRLMADRFYTKDFTNEVYTKFGLDWVSQEGYLHKVIGRHMPELKQKMEGLETAFNPWRE